MGGTCRGLSLGSLITAFAAAAWGAAMLSCHIHALILKNATLSLFLSLLSPNRVFSISFSHFGNVVSMPVLAELHVEALADRSDSDFGFKNVNTLAKMDCDFQLGVLAWPEQPALATPGTKTVS